MIIKGRSSPRRKAEDVSYSSMRRRPRKNGGQSISRPFLRRALVFYPAPTMVLSVNDRVKSRATLYDEGTEDENGLRFSQRQSVG